MRDGCTCGDMAGSSVYYADCPVHNPPSPTPTASGQDGAGLVGPCEVHVPERDQSSPWCAACRASNPPAVLTARLSEPDVVEAAAVLRRFARWVAIARAYNGSDHQHGQSLYNECINGVLPQWVEEFIIEAEVPER